MSDPRQEAQKKLDELRKSYSQKLEKKIADVHDRWKTFIGSEWQKASFDELYKAVHSLAGSGATFGFDLVSRTASTLERLFLALEKREQHPDKAEKKQIESLIAELRQAATDPAKMSRLKALEKSIKKTPATKTEKPKTVFLVDDDEDVTEELSIQIGYYGYEVRAFTSLEEAKKAISADPVAVIMDIVFPEGNLAGPNAMKELQEGRDEPIPVIFISSRADMRSRLASVRAGGKAYFTKPVTADAVIEKLDALTNTEVEDPYKIMIIEDEEDLAKTYSLILQQFEMITEIVSDPMDVIEHLTEFRPELILMDLYMPKCNGLELAAVIRQEEDYIGIPIVFLSTETNIDKQLSAIKLGGDEFLVKPIKTDHLISSIVPRVKRSRILHSYMLRDSMTKLFNHTTIKQKLEVEVSRAQRQNGKMAFAMIDIDHFKSVNDTYGHSTGDRIIKSLASLLQQRLRITDVIGRYGGEEFAVVFPETDIQNAFNVMDEMRKTFGAIRHRSDDKDFYVTFSSGIAAFPEFPEAEEMSEAADQALYEAKNAGRNKVVVAGK